MFIKFVAIFILSLFFQLSYPQAVVPNQFLNMNWGSSKSIVTKTMQQKDNVKLIFESDTMLTFGGGKFGGREVLEWHFYFWNDKFYSVTMFIGVPTPIYLDDMYYELKKDITNKYGKPSIIDSASYSERYMYWEFIDKTTNETNYFIYLSINLKPFFNIVLAYQNEAMFNKKLESGKTKKEKELDEL